MKILRGSVIVWALAVAAPAGAALIEPADYACGRGWHLNSKGLCVANRHGPPLSSLWGNPNPRPLSPQTQYNNGLPPPPAWQADPAPWGGPPPPPNW